MYIPGSVCITADVIMGLTAIAYAWKAVTYSLRQKPNFHEEKQKMDRQEQTNTLLNSFEHLIDRLPNRRFSYTYPYDENFKRERTITIWYDGMWHGESTFTHDPGGPYNASTFREICDALSISDWPPTTLQKFVDAAIELDQEEVTNKYHAIPKKERRRKSHAREADR